MSDIELVIKIPEDHKRVIDNLVTDGKGYLLPCEVEDTLAKAVRIGRALPKGHGDLIDRSKIHKAIPAEEDNCTGMGMSYDEMDAYNDGIDAMYNLLQDVKPIIEADTESEVNE